MPRAHKRLIPVAIIIVLWWKVFPGVAFELRRTLFPDIALIYIVIAHGLVFLGLSIAAWKIAVSVPQREADRPHSSYDFPGKFDINLPNKHRARQFVKWAGVIMSVLLLLAIYLSKWWSFSWGSESYWGYVQWGAIGLGHTNWPGAFPWTVRENPVPFPMFWWFHYYPGNPSLSPCFLTPLWVPLAVIGVPTILAWRRDRPFPPNHCRHCGYDLTGNVSGVCPECGKAIKP